MTEVARPERDPGDPGDTGDAGERPRGRARRGPGRRPGPTETRDEILDAARALFAEKGYDATSLRSIARAAGVDPALVHHYFGNKEGVFTAAMRFPVDPGEFLPRIMATPRERLGEAMVRTFLTVWEDDARRAPILAMLRSAMTNERAAVAVREFVTSALFGRVAELGGIPRLRLNAAAGQMIGVMFLRYVLRVEPIASAGREELVELLAPTIQRYFDEPS
ncbi:TetR family transcriptional regulator [Actinomadura miaoliensis]|uniref:TetR family transcriptional regulator n=1 Tax=Actinomadura miaoliensis TaxID=430685 RepID=A0ABP7W359_9ACTN